MLKLKHLKLEQQRKYRLGTASNIYLGGGGGGGAELNRFYDAPTFILIFRRGISLNNKNKTYKKKTSILTNFLFFKSQNTTGSKEGSYKGSLIASTPHHKKEQMKPQRKFCLGTASNNYWGSVPVLRCTNLHPHLSPRFTQFGWTSLDVSNPTETPEKRRPPVGPRWAKKQTSVQLQPTK